MFQEGPDGYSRSFRGLGAVFRWISTRECHTHRFVFLTALPFQKGKVKSRLFVYGASLESGSLGRGQF